MNPETDYLVRRLRMRHLELLVVLCDAGSLRAAAVRLHLSQPALSKMLAEIESGFGARLFDRSPQGLAPNGLGLAAAYRARVILGELARARVEVDALRDGTDGVLRLGTLSVTAIVPRAIAALHRDHPGARVQIQEGRVRDLMQLLLDGGLDCVFGAITPEMLDSNLLAQLQPTVLLGDALCVLCSQSHPLARGRRALGWPDLAGFGWAAPPRDTLVRQALMKVFLDAGLEPPVPLVEAVSSVTLGAVLRLEPGLLIAARHEHAREEIARGGVKRLAVTPAAPLPSIGLYVRRTAQALPPLVLAFAQALRQTGERAASAPSRTAPRRAASARGARR